MFKTIKRNLIAWIIEIVKKEIESTIGKPNQNDTDFSFYEMIREQMYAFSYYAPGKRPDEKAATGLFAKLDKQKTRIDALEKFLGVEYVNEEKKFTGYKKKVVLKLKRNK